MVTEQVNYVDNIMDKTALAITPTLMKPLKGSFTWELKEGAHRYIMARDGLYVEGKNSVIHVCFKISDLDGIKMPYGEQKPFCHFKHGLVPSALKDELIRLCINSGDIEFASYVEADDSGDYKISVPSVISKSMGHISYNNQQDLNRVVIDLHTHGHGEAYFSKTDDKSDQHGIYIAIVVGRCNDPKNLDIEARIVVHGHFCPINWEPWEDVA